MQTILVVEDEVLIAELLATVLGEAGYQVVIAGNGREALEHLEAASLPHLILSDMMMPVMDGRELCKRLDARPDFRSIPVVLMSAMSGRVLWDGCQARAFLGKPFGVAQLLETVLGALTKGGCTA